MKRDLAWLLVGGIMVALVGYPIVERQAQWENRTLACWPQNDRHLPKPK